MISFIAKLLVSLNNNSRPSEMASGISFGLLLALIPAGNLLWIGIFIITFFLKHNISALLLSMGLFRLFISVLDPFLGILGETMLELTFLQSFFTSVYNTPILVYTNFNNTIVMGGFVFGVLLWIPVFLLFNVLIKIYRKKIAPGIAESKFIKFLKRVPIVSKLSKSIQKISILAS
jgi:uncharacterized protein (TIGR03546 family)